MDNPNAGPDPIVVERHGGNVAVVRIASRPLGVLGLGVRCSLHAQLQRLEADRTVRAVIITGTDTTFSVGANIREFEQTEAWLRDAEDVESALNALISAMSAPVIAAINGHAYGAGLVLATACDLRIAAASARLGVPEVTLGGLASGSGTQRLTRLLGPGRAMSLLLTGRIVSAEEALQLGLVDFLAADAELMSEALKLARQIAELPPLAVSTTKACVQVGLEHGWAAGMQRELDGAIEVGLSADALEGQRAFIEKRPAAFPSRSR